jgi:RsiW-degrading membrane proteinase PrsW (M82 family)
MAHWEVVLPVSCAASAVLWTSVAAWRTHAGGAHLVARALLGGGAAFGLASIAYDLLVLAKLPVTWADVQAGASGSAGTAIAIGLVEEGAKLAGLLLALGPRPRTRHVLASAAGVAAGFAALEAAISLAWAPWAPAALARVAFAPVAHGLLLVPLALGVAGTLVDPARPLRPALTGLAASALLHASGNLATAIPAGTGPAGFAAALLAPALLLHLRARRASAARRGAPARHGL